MFIPLKPGCNKRRDKQIILFRTCLRIRNIRSIPKVDDEIRSRLSIYLVGMVIAVRDTELSQCYKNIGAWIRELCRDA